MTRDCTFPRSTRRLHLVYALGMLMAWTAYLDHFPMVYFCDFKQALIAAQVTEQFKKHVLFLHQRSTGPDRQRYLSHLLTGG